jgi:hypothetical protein
MVEMVYFSTCWHQVCWSLSFQKTLVKLLPIRQKLKHNTTCPTPHRILEKNGFLLFGTENGEGVNDL